MSNEQIDLDAYAHHRPPFPVSPYLIVITMVVGIAVVGLADKCYDKPGLIISLVLYFCVGFGALHMAGVNQHKGWMRNIVASFDGINQLHLDQIERCNGLERTLHRLSDELGGLLWLSKALNELRIDDSLKGNILIKDLLRSYRHTLDEKILMIVQRMSRGSSFTPADLDKILRLHGTPEGLNDSLRTCKAAGDALRDLPERYRITIHEFALRMDRPVIEPAEATTK